MANGKEIRISIMSALNAAGIEATKSQVAAMSSSVQKSLGEMSTANKRHWADIKAAWDLGLSAIRTVGGLIRSALKKAFDAEYALTNFRTLLGSVEEAKKHVADLRNFASKTPLTFADLSQASKTLLAFGAEVKTVVPSLKMLGDISLGNAEKFQSLALAFGKVQAAGKLSGVELKQMIVAGFNPLVEISEKTGASMDELKKMMENGAISFDMVSAAMRSATSEGGRFNNAMEEASKTGTGLVSTLQDNWTAAVTKFGTAFLNASKEGLGAMIKKLQELNSDGTIEIWADKVSTAMISVVDSLRAAFGWFGKIQSAYNWVRDKGEQIGSAVGTTVGYFVCGGYNYGEALAMVADAYRQSGREIEDRKREAEEKAHRIRIEAERRNAEEAVARTAAEAAASEKEKSIQEIYTENKRKVAEKEAELVEAFDREIAAEQEKIDASGELADTYQMLADQAMEKGKAQIREMQKLNRTINRLRERVDEAEKGIERTKSGQAADARHKTGLFGQYQYGGRANGGENFTDWERAQRYAGWGDRDAQKAERRDAAAQKRFDRIREAMENGKTVSESDEKFFGRFRQFSEQRDGAQNAKNALEKAQNERDTLQKEMKKTLDEINANIKDALTVG